LVRKLATASSRAQMMMTGMDSAFPRLVNPISVFSA
jgi:hypothetical protein